MLIRTSVCSVLHFRRLGIVNCIALLLIVILGSGCKAQSFNDTAHVVTGAERTSEYLPALKGKNIAIVANPTSQINGTHLVDSLISLKVKVKLVFAPEHGFRGEAEAGEHVEDGFDKKSGVKVVSLYGNHKKPTADDLKNIDLVVFDIQDVGARFYTYISTLQYVMEACADNKIPLMIFDRPNPHGYYIDGPVLDTAFRSFIGMQPVPVVHGMTIAEYALMLSGEHWLNTKNDCKTTIIKMTGWDHNVLYRLPIPPSPNLPTQAAINLYPSLCFFEGTKVSLGRGTDLPFQQIGYPGNPDGTKEFTPISIPGKAKNPPHEGEKCIGFDLTDFGTLYADHGGKLYLNWLMQLYNDAPVKTDFFTPFFEKLAGNASLRKQIEAGDTEDQIRNSWGPDLEKFRAIRKKYLLYTDFK
jgi:uncharacterized protein YbbC (DUF1343 family)